MKYVQNLSRITKKRLWASIWSGDEKSVEEFFLYFFFACVRMYLAKVGSSAFSQNLKAIVFYDGGQATNVGRQGVDKHRSRVGRCEPRVGQLGAEVEVVKRKKATNAV